MDFEPTLVPALASAITTILFAGILAVCEIDKIGAEDTRRRLRGVTIMIAYVAVIVMGLTIVWYGVWVVVLDRNGSFVWPMAVVCTSGCFTILIGCRGIWRYFGDPQR